MEIKNKIKDFLEQETQRHIEDEKENLIEKGILDSFSMIKLIGFIESEFKIRVKMEELTPENFNSVATITQKVLTWQK